ncbi:SagB/ThcOx family dehydrogenase [Microbacterium aurugineum]
MSRWLKAEPGPFRRFESIERYLSASAMNVSNLAETAPRGVTPGARELPVPDAIPLPVPDYSAVDDLPYREVLRRRESTWPSGEVHSMNKLSAFLATALGQLERSPERSHERRSYPSPAGLFSVDAHVFSPTLNGNRIARYDPATHALAEHRESSIAALDGLTPATRYGPRSFASSSMVVFLVGRFDRIFERYGALSLRLVLLEAGHVGASLQLTAAAFGFASIPLGGYFDDEARQALRLGPDSKCLYLWSIG